MRNSVIRNNLLIIITMFFTFSCAQTKESEHNTSTKKVVLPEYIFTPTTTLNNQITETLAAAQAQNKQALFVLGAQWCHDSKSLAQQFSTPQMQKILTDYYQVLFVDAGFFEKGFDLVQQFNVPVYYGTPTVMVVDPHSNKIQNRLSMKKWLNAYKVPLNEYVEYFTNFATNNDKAVEVSSVMQTYLSAINDFETQQAVRLKTAYGVISPLLKQYMESDKKDSSAEFTDKWQQVSGFRSRIPDDIQVLITQAKSNVEAGSSAPLILPTYPAFTWE